MVVREAAALDAHAMSSVLEELVAAGKRQGRADLPYTVSHYLEHPARLHCFVAADDQRRILGFQSLKLATEGNSYGTPTGWGIIGTHVSPSAARSGIGSALFDATLAGARSADLPAIEAYIGKANMAALAYYEALGFRTGRFPDGIICKVLKLSQGPIG
jgi:ribosomal protein S18 acetylase RimI-like enzyme